MKSLISTLTLPALTLAFWNKAQIPTSTHILELESDSARLGIIADKRIETQTRIDHSDCFKHASQSLHSNCKSLGFDSHARVISAVQMTLCELSTAEHVSLPLECRSINGGSAPGALGRSAQHWSSYSGYLREIPQLCTAYRRFHEIDHAKSIYTNITLDKITLLSSLDSYHSRLIAREEELETLSRLLASIVSSLDQHSSSIGDSLSRIPSQTNELTNQIFQQVTTLLETIATTSHLANRDAASNLERYLQSTISEAQAALSSTTKDLTHDVELLTRSLNAVALSWNSRLVAFNKRLDGIWDETFVRKMALDQALDTLQYRVSESSDRVAAQLANTERLQELTIQTSTSLETTTTQILNASQNLEILQSIAHEIHGNLTQIRDSKWHVLSGSLSSLIEGIRFPAWQAQLVMHVVGVGASGIQNSVSVLLTFGCAILFLLSHTFRLASRLTKLVARQCSGRKHSSYEGPKPATMIKRRVFRRPVSDRSRISSMLPRYETGSL